MNLSEWGALHVMVVGDVMLDQYWFGQTDRVSPEAPVLVVGVQKKQSLPGGAANVALNLKGLGAQVSLYGIVGKDSEGNLLEALLKEQGVEAQFQAVPEQSTIVKLRVMGAHQQLMRLDFENSFEHHALQLTEKALNEMNRCRALVCSDYGKGSLSHISRLIERANLLGVPVFVDPKGRDFSKYRGAFLLSPNFKEFEAVFGVSQSEEEFLQKGQQALKDYQWQALLVTRGADGMTLFVPEQPPMTLAAHRHQVFDVTGAGDTVIATVAMAYAAGHPLAEAVEWANLAASLTVQKLGAQAIEYSELKQAATHTPELAAKCLPLDALLPLLKKMREQGKKIVFTNGCFDVLHSGHVRYLMDAKKRGDILIVGLNDDDSIRRLKGPTRPINALADRQWVLASLASVDWVVPFSEDTPYELIAAIIPDVLVKGGDYTPEQMVGSDIVMQHGGKVYSLSFYEGRSSTKILEKMKQEAVES